MKTRLGCIAKKAFCLQSSLVCVVNKASFAESVSGCKSLLVSCFMTSVRVSGDTSRSSTRLSASAR